MMILSAEYSQDKMSSTCLPPYSGVPRTPHSLYSGYLVDPTWHHPMKQEPEETSVNNDSGISASHYNSDGSVQNTSPQSYHSEARSDDSGQADHHTNATLGVLARPVMESSSSPKLSHSAESPAMIPRTVLQSYHSEARSDDSGQADHHTNATLGVLARPIMESPSSPKLSHSAESPALIPRTVLQSPSPKQQVSLQQRLSPLQQQLSPLQQHLSPQPHSVLNFLTPCDSSPQSPRTQQLSHPSIASPGAPPRHQEKTPDDNSRSSASSAEMDMYYEDPLRGLQMALQRRGMIGPLPSEQPVNGEKPLQCPLCQFSTTIRSAFNNHLMSEHSEQVSCHLCDFSAENHMKLREHLRVEHDTQLPDDEMASWGDEDEHGVSTPKVNSQGKVKTYRCKQCEYSTVTKLDFWEHSRGHIKPERLLTCPKCPFVTEYKHHLEYHLRNHFGSKPFKCNKCSYSCVNKSMLNSHLKSHSNVYQFRCADCAYATKYCHSLKLHLRKYGHNPAMVLNPDGSPNPLPIVDVYGTRRGPKRPKKPEESQSTQQPSIPALHSVFSGPYSFLPSQTMPYPFSTMMNNFHRSPLLGFPNHHSMMHDEPVQPKTDHDSSFFNEAINTIQQSTINNNQEGVKEYLTRVISTQQEIMARSVEDESLRTGAPLDLSRQEPEPQEQQVESSDQLQQTSDQFMTTKNRRKGKAFKLERITQHLHQQSSDEEVHEPSPKKLRLDFPNQELKEKPEELVQSIPTEVEDEHPSPSRVSLSESKNGAVKSTISEERKERWKNVKEVYDCPYCDMLFGDVVMYTMHMGYHGYQNPYTCNMCGHQTTDKVQFFLHLFRYAHN